MNTLIQPVLIRFFTYVFSSLVLMIPSWMGGLVILDTARGTVSLSLQTAALLVATAFVGNFGIAARWGVRVDPASVAPLILRLFLFAAAPALGALPASWAGYIYLDQVTSLIVFSYSGLALAASVALGGSAAIFAKWGIKR